MIISVRLQNFRSYDDRTFEFKAGTNALVGPNGTGKTNALEAIYSVLTGFSWRVKDELLIKHGADWARVDVVTDKHTYTLQLDNRQTPLKKTRQIDGNKRSDGFLNVVLFEPDFIRVLTDGPELRRSWLDGIIAQIKPGYDQVVAGYKRALSQRNALLKRGQIDTHHIFVWNIKLTEYGATIAQERAKLVKQINHSLSDEYHKLSSARESVEARYTPTFKGDYASGMLSALQQNVQRDAQLGFTTIGPHREDMELFMRKEPLTQTASRGEIRSLAVALVRQNEKLFADFVLLLDDILSELDEARSTSFAAHLQSVSQTIMTDTDLKKSDNTRLVKI